MPSSAVRFTGLTALLAVLLALAAYFAALKSDHAATNGGVGQELRKLAPYAQSITASVKGFSVDGDHTEWSLDECVETLRAVGYVNSLSLDYLGKGDPIKPLSMARDMLSAAIEAAEPA